MSGSKLGGLFWILVGLGSIGYWADRSFIHPTRVDREHLIQMAESGGSRAMIGNPPATIFLIVGVAAVAFGTNLLPKR